LAELKEFVKESGAVRKKIAGFHHNIPGFLEEHGIQLINSRTCEQTGIMIADVVCQGHTEKEKTFFPLSWSRKKVVEKIIEAMNNLDKQPLFDDRGAWQLFGKTREDMAIKIVISAAGELITAFPFFE
jgi:hypothetical protein